MSRYEDLRVQFLALELANRDNTKTQKDFNEAVCKYMDWSMGMALREAARDEKEGPLTREVSAMGLLCIRADARAMMMDWCCGPDAEDDDPESQPAPDADSLTGQGRC